MKSGTHRDFILQPDILQVIWNALSIPVLIVDAADLNIIEANKPARELFAEIRHDLIGEKFDSLNIWQNNPSAKEFLHKLLSSSETEDIELNLLINEGKRVDFLVNTRTFLFKDTTYRLLIMSDITTFRQDRDRHEQRERLDKAIGMRVLESEEKERNRFASELHDDIGPILSSIKLYLSSIDDLITRHEPVSGRVTQCMANIDEAIRRLKLITNNIFPELIDRFGLDLSVRTYIEKVCGLRGIDIKLESGIHKMRFPSKIEITLYRIIIELINNSIQHSGASRADLTLSYNGKILSVKYSDNGIGYDINSLYLKQSGSGFFNIINKVKTLEGEIDFMEKNGKVTTLISIKADPATVSQDFRFQRLGI